MSQSQELILAMYAGFGGIVLLTDTCTRKFATESGKGNNHNDFVLLKDSIRPILLCL
jgi:hypothetical protein